MRLGINKWDLEEDMFLQRCIAEYGSKPKAALYASTKMNRTFYACLRRMYSKKSYSKTSRLQVVIAEPHNLTNLRTFYF